MSAGSDERWIPAQTLRLRLLNLLIGAGWGVTVNENSLEALIPVLSSVTVIMKQKVPLSVGVPVMLL
jgi:hypothetical protein